MSSLQTDYSSVLRQIEELVLDPTVREIVARIDTRTLIEEVAESLYLEDFTVEDAQAVVHLGIDTQALLYPSDQVMKEFRTLLIFAVIALLSASSNPEYAAYIQPLQGKLMLLIAWHQLLMENKKAKENESKEEDQ